MLSQRFVRGREEASEEDSDGAWRGRRRRERVGDGDSPETSSKH